ncbi:amidohydrolase family protein [Microbacterium sp. KUDC0406]|uniref:amidohydrolase family protein n=1 Tax=Microbacterium sp. KUDC0406 TaxID=2909588 RepID=UPI001F3EFE40|nr:amidohydrolase family protein [Microbacterium sp. KUDC0406]UJP09968.1 amidohydrolase family protein [Microbacterium sp. KUDC0406]
MRVVDSHLHLWDPEVLTYTWLEGDLDTAYAAEQLLDDQIEDVDEQVAIFVQSDPVERQAIDEVRWVDSIALEAGVVAIVAGARLDRGRRTVKHLDALAAFERVVGVRHLLQGEKDGFARSADFIEGARAVASRGWTFDACVRDRQIPDVTALAEAVPDLRIVLDHLGKPAVGTDDAPLRPSAEWRRDIADLARHPQVYVKLSGLPAEAGGHWDEDQLEPFLDVVAGAFGEDRLMWGSDWPVSAVHAATDGGEDFFMEGLRDDWCHTVADWAADRGFDSDKVLWANALAFYGIR